MFELLKRSTIVSLWFVFLTFPLIVIKVNPGAGTIEWRWHNAVYIGIVAFIIGGVTKYFSDRKKKSENQSIAKVEVFKEEIPLVYRLFDTPKKMWIFCISILVVTVLLPKFLSPYQVNILTNALMYVVLGLGLNIVVGMAGLLDLGFVAFYAVGAYSYALLNLHYGIGFWLALPIGGLLAAFFGILLGFPVLRLRGDYLAIVTLGFGEIIRLVLENWTEFSQGVSGISNIPRPGLFGMQLSLDMAMDYIYYMMLAFAVITIFIVNRLQSSRLGRAWMALREDEIACQAMGIDKWKTKLVAFSLGAFWAGIVGVVFAAKSTYINPKSFSFMESAIILAIVVLGGMGSIVGVILGALILILMPEYLRGLSEYRMLVFGGVMVAMMIFRPQGLIGNMRKKYNISKNS
ncbi:MAG: high-affinity branched-chain amino acid ABC transporter permease LivM [Desulfotalea sp.]